MAVIKRAQRIADTVIGMKDEHAFRKALDAGCAVRYVVSNGKACGRNRTVSNSDLCLFSDAEGRIYRAVVGSKGIYDDPEYLALVQAGQVHTGELPA
jgi:hypothetical protein